MNQLMKQAARRKADYLNRVNRVIDYIETHLAEELSLEALAAVACFSRFHFHRIFQGVTGERLAPFIQRLRLEKAATRLRQNPAASITAVALGCGFASSASFANAFKRHFGLPASAYRETAPTPPEPRYIHPPRETGADQEIRLELRSDRLSYYLKSQDREQRVDIRDLPAWTVAYIRYTGAYKGDGKLFYRLWNKLAVWAAPRGLLQVPDPVYLSLYHDNPEITLEEKLRVSVCLGIDPAVETGGEVGKLQLPGGKYAVGRFLLGEEDYSTAWGWMYGTWLPVSGYQPDDGLTFEWFPPEQGRKNEGKRLVDICLPVKPL